MKKLLRYLMLAITSLVLTTCVRDTGIDQESGELDGRCGTRISQDDQRAFEQDFLEKVKADTIKDKSTNKKVIVIPVMVHVVYSDEEENISDSQVYSQIDALNRDFRFRNADKANIPDRFKDLASDMRIEFKLVENDLRGNPIDGITRTFTTEWGFTHDDAIKSTDQGGQDVWNPQFCLNIWVGNLTGGLLGYAQFPGGDPMTDGVVVNYQAFGESGTSTAPYDRGRTLTHEVGHWLGLYHIWGDDSYFGMTSCKGSDKIKDTPNQGGPNFGCPDTSTYSCESYDMYMNYMDYTDDGCMMMFTQGQKKRARSVLKIYHRGIYKHNKRVKTILGERK